MSLLCSGRFLDSDKYNKVAIKIIDKGMKKNLRLLRTPHVISWRTSLVQALVELAFSTNPSRPSLLPASPPTHRLFRATTRARSCNWNSRALFSSSLCWLLAPSPPRRGNVFAPRGSPRGGRPRSCRYAATRSNPARVFRSQTCRRILMMPHSIGTVAILLHPRPQESGRLQGHQGQRCRAALLASTANTSCRTLG